MSVTRIFDLLPHQLANFSKKDAVAGKENGQWIAYSTSDFIEHANNVSFGLMALGIGKGDKVATITNNRPEWNFLDIGIMQTGAIHVLIYPTISESDYKFILNDAEVKFVFVSDKDLYQKIVNIRSQVPSIKAIYTFNKVAEAQHWTEVSELGKKNPAHEKLNEIKAGIKETDLFTMIYTSGTTGNPKGVMLSHKNILSNVMACKDLPPCNEHDRALSFLPLCHVYERMIVYLYMYLGISVYYAESIEKVGDNLREVKPHIFTAVPRLLEKVYDKIIAKGKELTGIKKLLFFWAVNLGLRYELNGKNGWWYEFQLKIANKLIFNKWREALGGNVKVAVSGSAALQLRLIRVFWAARIPILEGYGLTETSPVIAVNTFESGCCKFGTVGPVINGVQVKIADDGEILCKGPSVMLGYHKRDDLTAEAITDGWFHTGDIGMIEDNKFLKITDRKKELFKTSGGKYIAPQQLENKFKESPFIEQIIVVGENRNFPSAIIIPAFAHLKKWCEIKGIPYTSNEEIIKNKEVLSRIHEDISELNKSFGKTEQVKKFELLAKEWTIDSGELTPTLKLKRKIIAEKYKDVIEKMYQNGNGN